MSLSAFAGSGSIPAITIDQVASRKLQAHSLALLLAISSVVVKPDNECGCAIGIIGLDALSIIKTGSHTHILRNEKKQPAIVEPLGAL